MIIVKSEDGERVLGGARVHLCGGTQMLPIEEATGEMDDKIYEIIDKYAERGSGEICGLWNSREVAGLGIGSVFLTRAAVAISQLIGLESLFALCAPYTVRMAETLGYELLENIGNKGTFYYPKLDLLATSMVLKDVQTLSKAEDEDKKNIFELSRNPVGRRVEILRNKEVEISYNLLIDNLEEFSFKDVLNMHTKQQLIEKFAKDNDIQIL